MNRQLDEPSRIIGSVDDLWHIERMAGPDEGSARDSFAILEKRLRPFLNRHISSLILQDADRDDVIQAVLTKIWAKRESFQPSTIGGWYQYAARSAWRTGLDFRRAERGEVLIEEFEDRIAEDSLIETVASIASSRRRLYQLADETWLGVCPDLPAAERAKKLLVAQLFYFQGSTPQEILDMAQTLKPTTRKEIDEWLTDRSVMLPLCYHHLYRSNEDLAKSVSEAYAASGGIWTELETRITVLRLRNGLTNDKLLRVETDATPEMIQRVTQNCLDSYPFVPLAKELKWVLRRHGSLATGMDLWKRLAFQYHVADELPQKQILERIAPSAEVFGVTITEAVLNAWFSIGRLFSQLEKQARRLNLND